MKLILASASPRRAEILRNAGFEFDVRPVHVDETPLVGERAEDYVRRLADAKAQLASEYASRNDDGAVVIGADTAVIIDGRILGKPVDARDARRMLSMLNGRDHDVVTGVSVSRIPPGEAAAFVELTRVSFLPLSDEDIEDYILSAEPFDKAGAYGIQGAGGRFIRRIEGCYFNVMGLPLSRLWSTLRRMEQDK